MINLFKKLLKKIKDILSSKQHEEHKEYSFLKIEFIDEFYYIDNQKFSIMDIDIIHYSVSTFENELPIYYIKLSFQTKVENILFNESFELINLENFINVISRFNLFVLPSILDKGIYFHNQEVVTLSFLSKMFEKYLISIYYSTLCKKNFFLEDISIGDLVERPRKYLSSGINNDKQFNIKILSHKLTLNRGYGIYPVLNNEIIIEDIFYSFDEEEVKREVIELFEKYNIEEQE